MKKIEKNILQILQDTNAAISSSDVKEALQKEVTRQYVTRLLGNLIESGKVEKTGSTRSARYKATEGTIVLQKELLHLEEHVVLNEIEEKLPELSSLPERTNSIFIYAFTEMLNNAIEHSSSPSVKIKVYLKSDELCFHIRDYGIGVFKNVQESRNLDSETAAMQDVMKGKTTTMPRSHSGEGIFFTSKVADVFELKSFSKLLRVDNTLPDTFFGSLEVNDRTEGTLVTFSIDPQTPKHLNDVFAKFTAGEDGDYGFNTTEIKIKLYQIGGVFISRSQARRVLDGLDKFTSIILDFDDVSTVGQAFADEVFRVFQSRYPDISIAPINMNESVEFMINRVEVPNQQDNSLFDE